MEIKEPRRPYKKKEEKVSRILTIRLTDGDYARLKKRAEIENLSIGRIARDVLTADTDIYFETLPELDVEEIEEIDDAREKPLTAGPPVWTPR
jgi:hypothetical protein